MSYYGTNPYMGGGGMMGMGASIPFSPQTLMLFRYMFYFISLALYGISFGLMVDKGTVVDVIQIDFSIKIWLMISIIVSIFCLCFVRLPVVYSQYTQSIAISSFYFFFFLLVGLGVGALYTFDIKPPPADNSGKSAELYGIGIGGLIILCITFLYLLYDQQPGIFSRRRYGGYGGLGGGYGGVGGQFF